MVPILPPSYSVTFIVALLVPLVIGVIVGLLIKNFLEVGLVVAAIILALIIAGFLSPDQVLKPLIGFLKSGSNVSDWINRVAGYLPYTSLAFIVGAIIGFVIG